MIELEFIESPIYFHNSTIEYYTKNNIQNKVLTELNNTNFPINSSRKNISDKKTTSFALGEVNYRGQYFVDKKTRGPSKWNNKFPKLYKLLKLLIKFYKPNFDYTTIQVNKNVFSLPHIDKNNVGPSYAIALGNFTGGKLVIEGTEYNIKNKFKKFDGTLGHWITSFIGDRYSLIYFTHTFKPPCPSLKHIKVQKFGLFKKDKLIKKYPKKL